MEIPQSAWTNAPTGSPTSMLFSLPSELLLLVFEFVDVLNFRQDVRRLAVSKKWYPYAKSILFSNLCGNQKHMLLIFRALNKSATLAAAQQLTKHIDLALMVEKSATGPNDQRIPSNLDALERLALVLKDFTALRTLVIRSGFTYAPMPSHIIPSIISLDQLTSLDLDILHVEIKKDTKHHLCQSISQQIPNLKSLRCRLPHICEKLLDSPPGNLKELIINISCDVGTMTSIEYCPGQAPVTYDELQARLKSQLLKVAASMCDPKIARLIYDGDFWPHSEAFDAVENRRVLIWGRAGWDDDGVPITEMIDVGWETGDEISSDDEYYDYAL